MRIALVDPFAGIAGDMFVGACLHAGATVRYLRNGLAKLDLTDYTVSARRVMRAGISAKKFRVRHKEGHHHRGLTTILKLIRRAKLPARVTERATTAFTVLGVAEAKIHGVSVDDVHFHEVGAVDAICDIVGAALCLEELAVVKLFSRALPLSSGSVVAAHGRMPIPAPATFELLKGLATYDSGLTGELVTPTGAALIAAWAEPGSPPPFVPRAIGYGAGDRDPDGYANVCRVTVGDADAKAPDGLCELSSEIDDATPQVLGHLLAQLLEGGALDASLQPVVMKKDRPGTRVVALARRIDVPRVERVLFLEGTTLGVRRVDVERTALPRRIVKVKTPWGSVRLKIGELGDEVVHVAPEYEDCRAVAREAGVPLREVIRAALLKWPR